MPTTTLIPNHTTQPSFQFVKFSWLTYQYQLASRGERSRCLPTTTHRLKTVFNHANWPSMVLRPGNPVQPLVAPCLTWTPAQAPDHLAYLVLTAVPPCKLTRILDHNFIEAALQAAASFQTIPVLGTNEDPGNQVHRGYLQELAFLRPFPEYTGAYLSETASPKTILGPRNKKDPGICDYQGHLPELTLSSPVPGQCCHKFTE